MARPVVATMALACALAAAMLLAGADRSPAATSSVVVTATVVSATNIDASACAGATAATDFGNLLPGQSTVTGSDCSVAFGSSNDTSMLRMYQADMSGRAMWRSANGVVDPTFNGVGTQHTSLVAGMDEALGAAVQPTGEVVVAGYAFNGTNDDVAIARYTAAGAFDTTFNGTGKVILDVGGNDRANDVAIQSDGKIVTVGYASNGTDDDFAIERFLANGTLDTSFNGTGKKLLPVGAALDRANGVAIQPDGKIVIVGSTYNGLNDDEAIVRLNTDGTLDTTFNGTGKLSQDISSGDHGYAVALQTDGKIVTVGGKANDNAMFVRRTTTTGTADATFATGGLLQSAAGMRLYGVAIARDGTIAVAGKSPGPGAGTFVGRITTGGAFDATFNGTGYVNDVLGNGSAVFHDVVVQYDGRIVAVGESCCYRQSVARFTASGALDSTFGTNGISTVMSNFGVNGYGNAITGDADGAMYVVGRSDNDFGIVRYGSVGVADYAAGLTTWSFGSNTFGACLRAVSGVGVTGTWSVTGSCTAVDGANWNPIPTTSAAAGAKVAQSATSGLTTASASLRFGFRTSSSQAPGTYLAPITLEVLAPTV